jgi:hypothetical protein
MEAETVAPVLSEAAQIIITLISVVGSIVVAGFTFLGVRANETRRHARSAAEDSAITKLEVKNSHTTNFRDESDERHNQVMEVLHDQTKSISGIKRDIGRLADTDLELSRQAREDRARLTAHIERVIDDAKN